VAGPEILNKYWGQSEARLRGIFAEARAKAPAVILFDEIDSFASSRDAMSESFEATLVSQLLSLDGRDERPGAGLRYRHHQPPERPGPRPEAPGRFDHEIEVGSPTPRRACTS
jgi:transitional endoplasmic reticulum ATPase